MSEELPPRGLLRERSANEGAAHEGAGREGSAHEGAAHEGTADVGTARDAVPHEDDPFWDQVAAGELDADELAVLRALAEEDGEHARVAAFEPIDVARREAIAGKLVANVRLAQRRRRIAWSMGGLAAAAAIALVLWWPRAEALPTYAMVVSSGAATSRALPSERTSEGPNEAPREGPAEVEVARTFAARTRFELVLTPAREVDDDVVFSTFAEVEGRLVPWSVELQRSVSGAARVVGVAGEVLPRGVSAVVVAIDREARSLEDVQRWIVARDPRVLRARVELLP